MLTNYGEIFEVWFDGANGGSGFYGGKNEIRKVDKKTYYDWENTHKIIRELQPNAVIFSDAGPDIRGLETKKDMQIRQHGQIFIKIVYMVECLIITNFHLVKKRLSFYSH